MWKLARNLFCPHGLFILELPCIFFSFCVPESPEPAVRRRKHTTVHFGDTTVDICRHSKDIAIYCLPLLTANFVGQTTSSIHTDVIDDNKLGEFIFIGYGLLWLYLRWISVWNNFGEEVGAQPKICYTENFKWPDFNGYSVNCWNFTEIYTTENIILCTLTLWISQRKLFLIYLILSRGAQTLHRSVQRSTRTLAQT